MFLEELPEEGVDVEDLSATGAGKPPPGERWRTDKDSGWFDAGLRPTSRREAAQEKTAKAGTMTVDPQHFAEGMLVQHDRYGVGRITAVSGHGALRKLKIRFSTSGERTFVADKARLVIVQTD
jgi:DNA helicase-2/ATP-dependent DNA helicase PcrA